MGGISLAYSVFILFLLGVVNSEEASCPDTYEYSDCGSPCPLNCDNYLNPPVCLTVCASGCFCPGGTVEHNDTCITPTDCPDSTQSCPETYEFNECGSPCRRTCDNYNQEIFCATVCEPGCFCPGGTVEHNDTCITPTDCPDSTQSCPETYEFNECGSPCRRTCDNYNQEIFCATVCEPGCFCPDGTVEHNGRCVAVEQCPATCSGGKEWQDCGTACPLTCDNYKETVFCTRQCVPGCFCPSGTFDLNGVCVKNTTCDGCRYCREGQTCVAVKDDMYEYAMCKDPIAVPCTGGDDSCDPGYRCVTHNVTGNDFCVRSCYLQNGGCSEDQVCYYQRKDDDDDDKHHDEHHNDDDDDDDDDESEEDDDDSESEEEEEECNQLLEPCFQTTCTSLPVKSGDCPVGWILNQCGSICQRSCDDYITGSGQVCPAVCAPPDCVCPRGMVVFRDRCVDPLECYALLTTEPDLNPLPVPVDALLLQVTLDSVEKDDVNGAQFVDGLKDLLEEQGLDDISVTLFATLETEDGSIVIILQFKKRRVGEDGKPPAISVSPETLEQIIMDNPGELNHRVSDVQSIGERSESDEDEDSASLSSEAVAGIITAGVLLVLGLVVTTAIIIGIVSCIAAKNINSRKGNDIPLENSYSKLEKKEEFA